MRDIRPCKENICAVIVTYHPDDGFKERVIDILKQTGQVVVVDNNSSKHETAYISDLSLSLGFNAIFNSGNLGVAAALNQGVKWAMEKGFSWVLLFDQDTVVKDYMIDSLGEVYDAYPYKDRIAVIGSNYTDSYTNRQLHKDEMEEGQLWVEKKTVITSGSLIPVKIFKIVGMFREEFFIDHVDDDFCLRAKHKGFKVILALKEVMRHSLGASTMHNLPWRQTGTSNHSPMRRYYMTRNHLILIKENLFKETGWVFDTVYCRIKSLILMGLFEENRPAKLKAVCIGFFHGLFNIDLKKHKDN